MRRTIPVSLVFVFCVSGTAFAFPSFGSGIPNGVAGGETRCWMCHDNANGGNSCAPGTAPCLNPFGVDFNSSNSQHMSRSWDRWLAAVDSDNDGRSNGHELRSRWGANSAFSTSWTLPGNQSTNCSDIPSSNTGRRSRCNADFSGFSDFATSGRRELRKTAVNPCDSANMSDCASSATCSRNASNGVGNWSCSCDPGFARCVCA